MKFNIKRPFFLLIIFLCGIIVESKGQIPNLSGLVKKIDPCVAKIFTLNKSGEFERQGSAVFISTTGIAITNFHVLAGAKQAVVINSEGKQFSIIEILDYSESSDLIKFKVELTSNNKTISCKYKETPIEKGSNVFALGYPNGFEMSGESTLSTGIISGYREIEGVKYIQTTASITHGSSGGGLFDETGQLCGITSGTFASDIKDRHANLNKAIPVSELKKLTNNFRITLNQFYQKIYRSNVFSMAMLYYENLEFENAIIKFEEQLTNLPDDALSWMRLGNCYNQIGRKNVGNSKDYLYKAIDCFNISLELDNSNYHTYGQAALVYCYLNNNELAYDYALKCFELNRFGSFPNYIMGRVLNQMKKYKDATFFFSEAIKFESDLNKKDQLYLERAIAYGWLYEDRNAEADYLACIELNPDNLDAIFYFANFLAIRNRYDDACLYIKLLEQKKADYTDDQGNSVAEYKYSLCE